MSKIPYYRIRILSFCGGTHRHTCKTYSCWTAVKAGPYLACELRVCGEAWLGQTAGHVMSDCSSDLASLTWAAACWKSRIRTRRKKLLLIISIKYLSFKKLTWIENPATDSVNGFSFHAKLSENKKKSGYWRRKTYLVQVWPFPRCNLPISALKLP